MFASQQKSDQEGCGDTNLNHPLFCKHDFCDFERKRMKKNKSIAGKGQKMPVSKPPAGQLIPKGGEKYLKESANIEELPSPEESEKIENPTSKKYKKS